MPTTTTTALHDLLQPATVRIGLPGATKEEVIDAMVDVLRGHPAVEDLEAVREAVWAREATMSTGVGKGLGLPHAKTSAARRTVAAFAITRAPVDFGAIDDAPVRLVFLLVGTEAAKSEHIKILSRVSRLMNREAFRERLLQAESPDEIIALFEEGETRIAAQ